MALEGLSIFFPCHNEEANVEGVIRDALRVAPKVADRYEVIIIDDGSMDRTAEITKRFEEPTSHVRLVRHDVCKGYGEALKSGFRAARFPWIFYSDGDRQFDLRELERLVEKADHSDIVSGYRARRADPWYRTLNARLYGLALRGLIGIDIPDVNCAFKLCRREVFDHIQLKSSGALINAEIFAKAKRQGCVISTMPVTHRPRTAGRQTGAQLKVILKAMREFMLLWRDIRISDATK
jgi:glycosyltransferase involved in cell wall biosynthesis